MAPTLTSDKLEIQQDSISMTTDTHTSRGCRTSAYVHRSALKGAFGLVPALGHAAIPPYLHAFLS